MSFKNVSVRIYKYDIVVYYHIVVSHNTPVTPLPKVLHNGNFLISQKFGLTLKFAWVPRTRRCDQTASIKSEKPSPYPVQNR